MSDLLKACPDGGLELTWSDEHCHIVILPAKPSGYRNSDAESFHAHVIARVAALCNEHQPNSVSPYGGQGDFSWAERGLFQTKFSNTPGEQKLVLIPIN